MKSFYASLTAIALLTVALPAHAEDIVQLQQLISRRQCPGCNLVRAGLVYTDLSGVDLRGANLSQANLSHADLSSADLSGADLRSAVLFGANLSGVDFSGADLRGADMRGSFLVGANLDGAILDRAILLGAVGLPDSIATAEMLYQWGLLESENGNYELAIGYLSRSLERDPRNPQAYLGRSIARFRWGDPEGAYEDAKRAEELFAQKGDEQGRQTAVTLSEGIVEVQRRIAEGPEPPPPNFMNFVGAVGSILLRFALGGAL